MIILVNTIGLLLIAFIIYWFWLAKAHAVKTKEKKITVLVKDGVYQPSRIETKQHDIELEFIREDASPCSEYVVFSGLNIQEQLPLNQAKSIKLSQLKPGHYTFTCQMNMYRGELVVL